MSNNAKKTIKPLVAIRKVLLSDLPLKEATEEMKKLTAEDKVELASGCAEILGCVLEGNE